MIDSIAKVGLYGLVGFLCGLPLMTWIDPQTAPGRMAVLGVSVVFFTVFAKTVEWALRNGGMKIINKYWKK